MLGLVLGLVLGASGCGSADPQSVAVRWLLADGRSCIDAAVVEVVITPEGSAGAGAPVSQACPRTETANPVLVVPAVAPGTLLHGRALSDGDSVLYRADLRLPDPLPQDLDMTLYFTGGQ